MVFSLTSSKKKNNHTTEQVKQVKIQRSRQGMVSSTIWMKQEERKALKLLALMNDEGQEEFIIKAINMRLSELGTDLKIR